MPKLTFPYLSKYDKIARSASGALANRARSASGKATLMPKQAQRGLIRCLSGASFAWWQCIKLFNSSPFFKDLRLSWTTLSGPFPSPLSVFHIFPQLFSTLIKFSSSFLNFPTNFLNIPYLSSTILNFPQFISTLLIFP